VTISGVKSGYIRCEEKQKHNLVSHAWTHQSQYQFDPAQNWKVRQEVRGGALYGWGKKNVDMLCPRSWDKEGYKSAHMTKKPSYQHKRKAVMALWQRWAGTNYFYAHDEGWITCQYFRKSKLNLSIYSCIPSGMDCTAAVQLVYDCFLCSSGRNSVRTKQRYGKSDVTETVVCWEVQVLVNVSYHYS